MGNHLFFLVKGIFKLTDPLVQFDQVVICKIRNVLIVNFKIQRFPF